MGHMSFQTMFTRSRPKQWRKHRPVAEHGGKCLASTSSPLQRGSLISRSSSAGGFSSETSELHTLMRTVCGGRGERQRYPSRESEGSCALIGCRACLSGVCLLRQLRRACRQTQLSSRFSSPLQQCSSYPRAARLQITPRQPPLTHWTDSNTLRYADVFFFTIVV